MAQLDYSSMTINTRQRVAVVTGSSSGIGFETSLALARNRFHTFATMRNLEKSSNITGASRNENLPLQDNAATQRISVKIVFLFSPFKV